MMHFDTVGNLFTGHLLVIKAVRPSQELKQFTCCDTGNGSRTTL